jgi:AbiJ-like protein
MLTDIFAYRYLERPIWDSFDENARRLLVQGFRIISEQIYPYYSDGKERGGAKAIWDQMNKQLAMELGLKDLSSPTYGFWTKWNGNDQWMSGTNAKITVCEKFVCADFDNSVSADQFIKERLSFIEIAFRRREQEIAKENSELPSALAKAKIVAAGRTSRPRIPGSAEDGVRAWNKTLNDIFLASCNELNERFKQARVKLHYHNGFIQISEDERVTQEIEQPFWNLVRSPKWKNVDHDMKEAIDLRDSSGRDPAWYAAKALESTIKIISDEKGWTTGNERGAANYLDNLRARKNGEFINAWEHEGLSKFFSTVRNPLGHGAGSSEMPKLLPAQTDWAIEFCMIWVKNLIKRM